jgi:hypothetical protein
MCCAAALSLLEPNIDSFTSAVLPSLAVSVHKELIPVHGGTYCGDLCKDCFCVSYCCAQQRCQLSLLPAVTAAEVLLTPQTSQHKQAKPHAGSRTKTMQRQAIRPRVARCQLLRAGVPDCHFDSFETQQPTYAGPEGELLDDE